MAGHHLRPALHKRTEPFPFDHIDSNRQRRQTFAALEMHVFAALEPRSQHALSPETIFQGFNCHILEPSAARSSNYCSVSTIVTRHVHQTKCSPVGHHLGFGSNHQIWEDGSRGPRAGLGSLTIKTSAHHGIVLIVPTFVSPSLLSSTLSICVLLLVSRRYKPGRDIV